MTNIKISNIRICGICGVVILSTMVVSAAWAAPPKGGHGAAAPHAAAVPHAAAMPHPIGGGMPHAVPHVMGGVPHAIGGGGHFAGAAHVGGVHMGGAPHIARAPHIGGRPAISHFAGRPSVHSRHAHAVHGEPHQIAGHRAIANRAAHENPAPATGFNRNHPATATSNAVRQALSSSAVAGALRDKARLRNPTTRAEITASAAMAAWNGGHGERHGWWRHRDGGYGWVGPLFWPFAYDDIYDYAMWGYGDDTPFWDYGYGDIYAGLFYPYGYDELAGYLPEGGSPPQSSGGPVAAGEQLGQMCGQDSRDIAGLPIDQIQNAVQLNEAQRADLDDLASASLKAADGIKAACPTKVALTAPDRLADMQGRIEAMISAVTIMQPPLQKFYDALSDEQKARLNALGQDQRQQQNAQQSKSALAAGCGPTPSGVTEWPAAQIDARLHPSDAQRKSLAALKDATAKAADELKNSCQFEQAITPPARLAAVGKRLDVILQAVKNVRAALDNVYAGLSDEQKAQFEAIGPHLAVASGEAPAPPAEHHAQLQRHHYHHHHINIAGLIRHFISMAR